MRGEETVMGYPANTTTWKRGDIVVHAGDWKGDDRMLMRVTGYRPDGLVRTRYVWQTYPNMKGVCWCKLSSLLNPADFGIDTTRALQTIAGGRKRAS